MKYLNFILILFVLTAFGCKNKTFNIIPESTLTDILSDIYVADAIVTHSDNSIFNNPPKDSISFYEPIIKNHGYSLNDFRQSMLYYANKAGKLSTLYTKVDQKLKERKEIYKPLARIEELSKDLWSGNDSILIKSDSALSPVKYEILLKEKGVYDVSLEAFFFKDDSTINPRLEIGFSSDSNPDTLVAKKDIILKKDTIFNNYNISVLYEDETYNKLNVLWLNFDTVNIKRTPLMGKRKGKLVKLRDSVLGKQHVILKDMSIKYNFEKSEQLLDSIK